MWQSVRLSHTVLRLSLAFVFLWFGIDNFFHPDYWLNAWVPLSLVHIGNLVNINGHMLIYGFGIFEILVGISLITNMFVGVFATLAILFLIIQFFLGFNGMLVCYVGLVGGLLALALWPPGYIREY